MSLWQNSILPRAVLSLPLLDWIIIKSCLLDLKGLTSLGNSRPAHPFTWLVFGVVVIALAIFLARYLLNGRVSIGGLIGRVLLTLGLEV